VSAPQSEATQTSRDASRVATRGRQARGIQMSDWFPVLLLCATYAIAFVASGARVPERPRRPQFDPTLPTPKRSHLRLLRSAHG